MTSNISNLLRLQHGVISWPQAAACGLSRRKMDALLADGLWTRLARGVFMAGTTPSWTGLAWAGVLTGGPTSVIGARSSLHLQGLCDEPDEPILIHTARQYRGEPQPWWDFRRSICRGRGEPPRTPVEVALLDCWIMGDPDEFTALLGKAVSSRRTTLPRVRGELASRTRTPGRRELEALLGEAATGVMSPLEARYRRDVELAHGLPKAKRQSRGPGNTWRDCAYAAFGVVVELDGRRGHDGEGRLRDMARDNANMVAGYATLRFGWRDVTKDPCGVADQVATLLHARGWPGVLDGCPLCRGRRAA